MNIFEESLINKDLTLDILNKYNNGKIGIINNVALKEIPQIDNNLIIDFENLSSFKSNKNDIDYLFENYSIPKDIYDECKNSSFEISSDLLSKIGIYLYDKFSYGVLNGGSATSYVDYKKNKNFNINTFKSLEKLFKTLTPNYKNKAKGITPGFINPNGKPGPSFMELKMRALLLEAEKYQKLTGRNSSNLFPMFQMTSTSNNSSINEYYKTLNSSKFLTKLIKKTGINITNVKTSIQPLIAAYTHSNKGKNKEIFLDKNGKPLPLPGGHGQCFQVLKDIFLDLYNSGIRYISIGNVDNLGYTIDPKALAILAITNTDAIFDFSFKTIFDIKGGVLVKDINNRINCIDLGVGVTQLEIDQLNKDNSPILFNCATGLFNLKYLINNIEMISNNLPTRFTDQNKDIGEYSQAEQITWEILSILDNFKILAVDKFDRFLASKLLVENLLTSGIKCDIDDPKLQECTKTLNKGLNKKLETVYKLRLENGEWINND